MPELLSSVNIDIEVSQHALTRPFELGVEWHEPG